MRIIAGKYRGRQLAAFRGDDIRPTPDRVKESLFQILTPRLAGARVLDLFCGSGALGIEALSRGAAFVHFNDRSRESLALCEKNLRLLGAEGEITGLDYRTCLTRLSAPFDVIFCDPPYREAYAEEIMRIVAERGLLKDGVLVYESEREELPAEGWESERRSYGRTKIYFMTRSGA